MPNTINFPMNPTEFSTKKDSLITQAEAQNFTVTFEDNSGDVSGDGVHAQISYNGTDTLTVTIIKKPFFATEGFIEGKIQSWLNS